MILKIKNALKSLFQSDNQDVLLNKEIFNSVKQKKNKPKPIKRASTREEQNIKRTEKEIKNLALIEKQSVNPENLRLFTAADLAKIFSVEEVAINWKSCQEILQKCELPEMTGGVNPGDQRALFYLINALKPKNVLEIGTHIGCSTTLIALALKNSKNPKLTTVDIKDVNDPIEKPWLTRKSKYSPKELISLVNFEDQMSFVTQDSIEFLKNTSQKFDFIFLDGLHLAATVYQEIPLALNKLAKDGIILMHDYFPNNQPLWSNNSLIPGPFLAIQRFQKEVQQIKALPLDDLPWPTKLNSNKTSLAILTRK